jgi:hypothetical protein
MYARDGQDLYVVPGQPDRKLWWRNLRQPTPVRLCLQGRDREGHRHRQQRPRGRGRRPTPLPGPLPKAAKPLGVRVDANGTPHGTITAAHPLVVVRVHLDR